VRRVTASPLLTTYSYTAATGDLTSVDYNDTTPDVAITHDRLGRPATITDATGTRTFTYDSSKLRLATETLPSYFGDRVLTSLYQTTLTATAPTSLPGRSAGYQLGSAADPDRDYAFNHQFDVFGRISGVTAPSGAFTYAFEPKSDLVALLTSPVHTARTAYEPERDIIDYMENKVAVTTVSKHDYTVNAIGQRTARAQTSTAFAAASTDSFGYNAKGEVTSATNSTQSARNQAFAYDQIGNRLTFTTTAGTTNYTKNNLNQYTQITGFSAQPTHDHDGNQLTTGLGQAYVWDAENRLVSVEPVIPIASSKKVVNTYDYQSRRVRRVVLIYASGAWTLSTDEKYIYEGWNVIARLRLTSGTWALDATHTWGLDLSRTFQGAGGVGGLLSVSEGSNSYHYTYDANGNVSEVLNAAGVVAAHYEYDAFGGTVQATGAYAQSNEYRFSTKPFESETGLYYYGYRFYDPSTGRWLSRDPIGERGGRNLYGMVGNNFINRWDLLGLKWSFLNLILNKDDVTKLNKIDEKVTSSDILKILDKSFPLGPATLLTDLDSHVKIGLGIVCTELKVARRDCLVEALACTQGSKAQFDTGKRSAKIYEAMKIICNAAKN